MEGLSASSKSDLTLLIWLLGMKSIGTAMALSMKIPCGVFTPVFILGAAFGRIYGMMLCEHHETRGFTDTLSSMFGIIDLDNGQGSSSQPLSDGNTHPVPALYAMVGAACVTAGVTRTISVSIIVCELTGQINHMSALLISVCLSYMVASTFCPPVFDVMLHSKCLRFLPHLRNPVTY